MVNLTPVAKQITEDQICHYVRGLQTMNIHHLIFEMQISFIIANISAMTIENSGFYKDVIRIHN